MKWDTGPTANSDQRGNHDIMLEMISIHIARTGGRSFYEILKNEYGAALDPRFKRKHFFPGGDFSNKLINRIPNGIKVIHGHLFYSDIRDIHLEMKPKVITWMRDPVERVISNYFFLMKQVRTDPGHPQARKSAYTLMDYARDSRRNKMSLFLDGIALEEFFFIGFQETFRADLEVLARHLEWKKPLPDVHINQSEDADELEDIPTHRNEINQAMREEISSLNEKDIELYKMARSLRNSNSNA